MTPPAPRMVIIDSSLAGGRHDAATRPVSSSLNRFGGADQTFGMSAKSPPGTFRSSAARADRIHFK
jgi:hypothetical protein